ncbi:unnamed protein product [Dicrocoelium dendriticum]|nr:unnamed protein product [Dicrocoelium dendriticum]
MLLLRLHMLFVFTGLHDFLAHRVESLRIRIVQNWGLPDVLESQEPRSDPASSDLGQLIRDHESTLSDLESICLLTESSSMLRNEINNLCHMSLTFQSLWSQCRSYSDLLPRLVDLGSAFHNHIKFLAQLLFRAVRISNARRLLPLAETFIIASSFTYPP